MADKTKIEWTDATWPITTGCTVVSPGCTNCYAMRLAGTRLQHHPSRKGLTQDTKAGPVWNGEVRFNEQWLDQPLRWKAPRRMIFVSAHGDLFHESVPDEWIDKVFAVMALAPQHTFQVLTKRAARMREYLSEATRYDRVFAASCEITRAERGGFGLARGGPRENWPLRQAWIGVSVEDQVRADERIPDLLATPAAVRFLSCEPLLGPIDLRSLGGLGSAKSYGAHGWSAIWRNNGLGRAWLDWVIVGGESGPKARPMHPCWARSLRDQCQAAGVPFFFKQHGNWHQSAGLRAVGPVPEDRQCWLAADGRRFDPSEAETEKVERLERRAGQPLFTLMVNVGKEKAGRLLDGVEWSEMPS